MWIKEALLNSLPHRKKLLLALEQELNKRGALIPFQRELARLRENLLQYPKQEQLTLAATLAELIKRLQEKGPLFVSGEEHGYRGRKWSAAYEPVYVVVEIGDWLAQVRKIHARGEDYVIEFEPGQVVVTFEPTDMGSGSQEILETVELKKPPKIKIVPVPTARSV